MPRAPRRRRAAALAGPQRAEPEWRSRLRTAVSDAYRTLGWLLFIIIDQERDVAMIRKQLRIFRPRIALLALGRMSSRRRLQQLPPLEECTAKVRELLASERRMLRVSPVTAISFWMQAVLSDLLVHVLVGDADADRPLAQKIGWQRTRSMDRVFGQPYLTALQEGMRPGALMPVVGRLPQSFPQFARRPSVPAQTDMAALRQLGPPARWVVDPTVHEDRRQAFLHRQERAREEQTLRSAINLSYSYEKSASSPAAALIIAQDREAMKARLKPLQEADRLLLVRAQKHRLFPTASQARQLRSYMAAARWTYNQCVAFARQPTMAVNLSTLVAHCVTRKTALHRNYPDGMAAPPAWVFNTPASVRNNAVRQFLAARKAASTNLHRGHINHFNMHFKSVRTHRHFTISEDGRRVQVAESSTPGRRLLSITDLTGISVRMPADTEIAGAVKIVFLHGYWYAVVPTVVEPAELSPQGGCTAGDPGVKCFMTTIDLEGNVVHYGRRPREQDERHPDKITRLSQRISRAQAAMSNFQNIEGRRHTSREWRAYNLAKREFHRCWALLGYQVDELHHKVIAQLVQSADVIIIPEFRSKSMLLPSAPRTHTFNRNLLSLKHYKFRQRLQAVCERTGKTVVVCSEMYTSMSCPNCTLLYENLGAQDVYACPHCGFTAGRDEAAAFNILRFVSAGSLNVMQINNVKEQ